jgi:hypothetical protein
MINTPPPIYYRHLEDARKRLWRSLSDYPGILEPHKTYIGTLYLEDARAWALVRVEFCTECGHFEVAQSLSVDQRCHAAAPVTHIAEDVLGTPPLPSQRGGAN